MKLPFPGQLLATLVGTTLFLGSGLNASPAIALTFLFESSDIRLNGSYTIDESIFDSLAASPSGLSFENPLTDFTFNIDRSGLFSSTISGGAEGFLLQVKTNESVASDPVGGEFGPFAIAFSFNLTAPEGGLGLCKFQQCEGTGSYGGRGGPAGFRVTQRPASVPEPATLLGLSVIGSGLLLRRRSVFKG